MKKLCLTWATECCRVSTVGVLGQTFHLSSPTSLPSMVDTSGQSTSPSVGEAAPSQKRDVASGRAFWINPGFVWNKWQMQHQGSDRYTVSQRIVLFLLIGSHGPQRARLADNDALLMLLAPRSERTGHRHAPPRAAGGPCKHRRRHVHGSRDGALVQAAGAPPCWPPRLCGNLLKKP